MSYQCPRDHSNLYWSDFLNKGRWFCRTCSGTLVFEKHLKLLPNSERFYNFVSEHQGEETRIKCPICNEQMLAYRFPHKERIVDIDRCEHCALFWFDPIELKLLTGASDQLPQEQQAPMNKVDALAAFHRAVQQYHEEEETKYKKWFQRICIACILICIFLVIAFYPVHNQYTGIRVRGASDPLGTSILALIFFGISLFKLEKSRWYFFMGFLLLFRGAMVWLARF